MKLLQHRYRGPLISTLLLSACSIWWAGGQLPKALDRERESTQRHAHSLARGLSVLSDQIKAPEPLHDVQLTQEILNHLNIGPPVRFVRVMRGDVVLLHLGEPAPTRLAPGFYEEPFLIVTQERIDAPDELPAHGRCTDGGVPCVERGPGGGRMHGPPWGWGRVEANEEVAPLWLFVGMEAGFAPGARAVVMRQTLTVLVLVWSMIAMLAMAWVRSIRSRDLIAAFEAEQRKRARLMELNLAAAGLAHETKNPLGLILGLAQRMANDPLMSEAAREAAEQIMDEADRAASRLSDFLNFASLPKPQLREVAIDEVIARVTRTLKSDFEYAGVELSLELAPCLVAVDVGMIEQVLVNLLLNSLSACEAGSRVSIILVCHQLSASLMVIDQGCGIAPELLPDIFKPYVTGRSAGHGLGLAVVRRIVEQHGWSISAQSRQGQGATFSITGLKIAQPHTEPR